MARGNYVLARAVKPNAGVRAKYEKTLFALLEKAHKTLVLPLLDQYAGLAPGVSMPDAPARDAYGYDPLVYDAKPVKADYIIAAFRQRFNEWMEKNAPLFEDTALWFGTTSGKATNNAVKQSLAMALGHTVTLQLTPGMEAVLAKVAKDNVALIKSIHTTFHDQVVEEVLKSAMKGRDVGGLAKVLQERFKVSKSRAALIAMDQNNKATAKIEQTRRQELGITTAVWLHSGAGKFPRLSHKAAHGREFDVEKGCRIDGKYILPGEEIGCKCTSAAKVPLFGNWRPDTDVSAYANE